MKEILAEWLLFDAEYAEDQRSREIETFNV